MLTSKQTSLKPLIESRDGFHLTAYLVNQGDLADLKLQLSQTVQEARDWLHPVMPAEDLKKFLEPLEILLYDGRILSEMKGNIGIFRNEELFRILNIPIDVQPGCQVATSFHVKPLLRWLQGDDDFFILGLEDKEVFLYVGSQQAFRLIDVFPLPSRRRLQLETFSQINDLIFELTKDYKPRLFLAGAPALVRELKRVLRYKNLVKTPLKNSFHEKDSLELCAAVRKLLLETSRENLEKSLREFRFAEEENRAQKNIFHIAKAVVLGKVRKLIVTDELSIFGKLDRRSGDLSIHPFDLDHEDDCVLDDLAQMVLSQGGEVLVAKREEIPKGRPILAILEDDDLSLEKKEEALKTIEGSIL